MVPPPWNQQLAAARGLCGTSKGHGYARGLCAGQQWHWHSEHGFRDLRGPNLNVNAIPP